MSYVRLQCASQRAVFSSCARGQEAWLACPICSLLSATELYAAWVQAFASSGTILMSLPSAVVADVRAGLRSEAVEPGGEPLEVADAGPVVRLGRVEHP
jgi:hypothetical protein